MYTGKLPSRLALQLRNDKLPTTHTTIAAHVSYAAATGPICVHVSTCIYAAGINIQVNQLARNEYFQLIMSLAFFQVS